LLSQRNLPEEAKAAEADEGVELEALKDVPKGFSFVSGKSPAALPVRKCTDDAETLVLNACDCKACSDHMYVRLQEGRRFAKSISAKEG
jgi:hypothetical protein